MTRETVFFETLASRAMSLMVSLGFAFERRLPLGSVSAAVEGLRSPDFLDLLIVSARISHEWRDDRAGMWIHKGLSENKANSDRPHRSEVHTSELQSLM